MMYRGAAQQIVIRDLKSVEFGGARTIASDAGSDLTL
jgi:hypothetical protein